MILYVAAREIHRTHLDCAGERVGGFLFPTLLDLDSRIGGEGKGKRTNGFRPDATVPRPTAHNSPSGPSPAPRTRASISTLRIRLGTNARLEGLLLPSSSSPPHPSTGSTTAREVGSAICPHIIQGGAGYHRLSPEEDGLGDGVAPDVRPRQRSARW